MEDSPLIKKRGRPKRSNSKALEDNSVAIRKPNTSIPSSAKPTGKPASTTMNRDSKPQALSRSKSVAKDAQSTVAITRATAKKAASATNMNDDNQIVVDIEDSPEPIDRENANLTTSLKRPGSPTNGRAVKAKKAQVHDKVSPIVQKRAQIGSEISGHAYTIGCVLSMYTNE